MTIVKLKHSCFAFFPALFALSAWTGSAQAHDMEMAASQLIHCRDAIIYTNVL